MDSRLRGSKGGRPQGSPLPEGGGNGGVVVVEIIRFSFLRFFWGAETNPFSCVNWDSFVVVVETSGGGLPEGDLGLDGAYCGVVGCGCMFRLGRIAGLWGLWQGGVGTGGGGDHKGRPYGMGCGYGGWAAREPPLQMGAWFESGSHPHLNLPPSRGKR